MAGNMYNNSFDLILIEYVHIYISKNKYRQIFIKLIFKADIVNNLDNFHCHAQSGIMIMLILSGVIGLQVTLGLMTALYQKCN